MALDLHELASKVVIRSEITPSGWFSEFIDDGISQDNSFSLKVDEVLYQKKSKYQDVLVFKSPTFGNVLVLDGIINVTERDEFVYQEMMACVPVMSHPNPENVLVIGGGDGGVVRELSKHPEVKTITMCEIDEDVVNVSKQYLPGLACGFDSPKLTLHIGDGFKFMEEHSNCFDVIITDSSDPIGPGEALFRKEYYHLLNNALKPGGIIASQGETMWISSIGEYCQQLMGELQEIFPVVDYSHFGMPSYTSGCLGLILASKNKDTNFRDPRPLSGDHEDAMDLNYYNTDIHKASCVMPQFVKRMERKFRK